MGPPQLQNADTSIHLLNLRLSQSETRLLQTLDSLDALHFASAQNQRTLQEKYDRLKGKARGYLSLIEVLEKERDELREAVGEVIRKVERSNGNLDYNSIWRPPRLVLNGKSTLADSLQPDIHHQLSSSSQASPSFYDAQPIINSLQLSLNSTRVLMQALEERNALLEAMVARRDAEIQALLFVPGDQQPSNNDVDIKSSDAAHLLEAQEKRNRALEQEIKVLKNRLLDEDVSSSPSPPTPKPRNRTRSRGREQHPQQPLGPSSSTPLEPAALLPPIALVAAPPYSSSLEKLKLLDRPQSTTSSSGKRKQPASNARRSTSRPSRASVYDTLASQLVQLERGVQALRLERESQPSSHGHREASPPPRRPASAPGIRPPPPARPPMSSDVAHPIPLDLAPKPAIFVELQSTITKLGREVGKLRNLKDELGTRTGREVAAPLRQAQEEEEESRNFRGRFDDIRSPTSSPSPSAPSSRSVSQPSASHPREEAEGPTHELRQLQAQLSELRRERDVLKDIVQKEGFGLSPLRQSSQLPDESQLQYLTPPRQRPPPIKGSPYPRGQPPPDSDDEEDGEEAGGEGRHADLVSELDLDVNLTLPTTTGMMSMRHDQEGGFNEMMGWSFPGQRSPEHEAQEEVDPEKSPTQTIFTQRRPYVPSSHPPPPALDQEGDLISFNSESVEGSGGGPSGLYVPHPIPTVEEFESPPAALRVDQIWSSPSASDPESEDGERSMELATPLIPSSVMLLSSSSSSFSGTPDSSSRPRTPDEVEEDGGGVESWAADVTVDPEDGVEWMEEATIPLPPSPPSR